ncbi:MAG: glycoside hydrolase family 9 protein [Fibrobacter sp.]|uniref:glycoside hydrolase family 9 protein n=1 Tax=Fibrobacter sp. TaxID=35828 RepID=UPI0025BD6477|nr:glycoside hydrolase family 9 protein [Fibrobacter sp.]MBQ3715287.1 glycoside hydrolase family 9 protein [Fibrobacter sp.]MBQ7078086.1 glycoside hydrolase family 9 protein [Fibrobacter sp.]
MKSMFLTASAILALTGVSFAATAYINQVGYRTGDFKELTLFEGSGNVDFVDQSGQTVLSVTPSAAANWNGSGQSVQLVDFSALKTPGTYTVKVNGQEVRKDLKITDDAYGDVSKALLKWFYYQRASMALEEQYAGKWKRSAGHPDMGVAFHSSATGGSGTVDSPKGWYDAGDYGKYIVNSGISTYTLLSLYEHFPAYFDNLKWNIPADGSLPDLLAEIKYNLDWMLTMQAADGGVYHKLTTLEFCGTIMPNEDVDTRYIIGKSSTATFDFAGVMAVAARVYRKFDASYADKVLEAAKKAYEWGSANSNVYYKQPSDVATGTYSDNNSSDEKEFASVELYVTTKDAAYASTKEPSGSIPGWAEMSGLATYCKATHPDVFGDAEAAKDTLLSVADLYASRASTGFGVPMSKGDFYWGSNSVAANMGVWLLYAYYLTGDKKYYQSAVKTLDYLLGKNPLDMSFVTGFGSKSPKHPHHRPSQADGISEPVPGMLVGGPQPGGEDIGSQEWQCRDYRVNNAPAKSYLDDECSYASNEVAINWNSPAAYLAGALQAINAGHAPSFAVEGLIALPKVRPVARTVVGSPKVRFDTHRVYIESNGVRYDLKGNKLK